MNKHLITWAKLSVGVLIENQSAQGNGADDMPPPTPLPIMRAQASKGGGTPPRLRGWVSVRPHAADLIKALIRSAKNSTLGLALWGWGVSYA